MRILTLLKILEGALYTGYKSIKPFIIKINTVELQWLEQAGTIKISLSQR